jgi:hypothetical protein
MTETKKSARGLEEVSHFFLSRNSTGDQAEQDRENKAARASSLAPPPPDQNGPSSTGNFLQTKPATLKTAHEVDMAGIPSSALLQAARTYLLRADAYKEFVAVENIDSPRFGSSDLLLVNKTRTRVVCAKLARTKDCEAFVVSAIAFRGWLKSLMHVGASLFGQPATLDMVLFANGFPEAVACMMDEWAKDTKIHLITFNIFRVEDLRHPVVRFRPVRTGRVAQQKTEKPTAKKETATQNRYQQASESQDISRQEWETFQHLKDRDFT